jgi:hypothetical protein
LFFQARNYGLAADAGLLVVDDFLSMPTCILVVW